MDFFEEKEWLIFAQVQYKAILRKIFKYVKTFKYSDFFKPDQCKGSL